MSSSDPLLVPVEVQAMVLNSPAVNFVRAQMNYGNLESCQSPSPAPFQEDEVNFATNLNNHGVYLRWTLPHALRHAEKGTDGSMHFPFVPNRWLVVRVYRPGTPTSSPPTAAPQVTAWVVQSDYLGSTDGAVYVDPTKAVLTQIQIGRMVPVTAASPWQEPASSAPYFLRAVAESNTAFATYQPFNQNVFSIHDPLYTNSVGAGTLSYFVQGWYSDAKADILAGWSAGPKPTTFAEWLKQLNWSASNAQASATSSVYHGSAFGVPWSPQSSPPPSPKDSAKPQIAVANTSVDAIVAFAEAAFSAPGAKPPAGMTAKQAADLLEAFQYNLIPLLSQPGGEEQLEQKIRAQWFGSAPAGTSWTIVDAPVPPASGPPPEPSEAELAAEATWLGALNTAQEQFDRSIRTLLGLQRRLFELWWKQQASTPIVMQTGSFPWNTTPQQFAAALDANNPTGLIAQIRTILGQLTSLAEQVPTATAKVSLNDAILAFAAKKNLPSTRTLKAVARPRFWAPSDPVTVLSGTAHMMKIDSDDTLACRWPSEIVTGLNVNAAGGPAFPIASSQLIPVLPPVNVTNLPPPTLPLYVEFFLLDPANASVTATAAGQKALTTAQLTAVAASIAKPGISGGALPPLLAKYPWEQPWQPLYLDWAVTWYPVPFRNDNGDPNWTFNGTDYELASGVKQPASVTLNGRSVLTPKPSFEFKARIDQFITDNPTSPAAVSLQGIKNLIQTIDNDWDFLSQTLSGFGTQVASWNPVPTLLPPSTPLPGGNLGLSDLIGDQAQCPPQPLLAVPGRRIPPSTFEGMRGGQFCFSRLTIVDVFGQTLEIVTGQTATQTSIITGDGMHVINPLVHLNVAGYAQVPPRLLQPARLNFQFAPGAGTSNPILGWILPNHLDAGLTIYGLDGLLYGELAPAADRDGKPFVSWWPAPETPYPTLAKLVEDQPQFGGVLVALKQAGPSALRDFLRSVDETLWTVNPLGDRSDAFLTVLLGRPLAVVNASISFELQAEAWTDPAWPYTFMSPRPSPLFLNYQFPVQLGDLASRDDGLLGYFLDGKFDTFNAVHVVPPGKGEPPLSGYLAQIGQGNRIDLRFAASGPGPARALTLIMDPHAAVHARCGILPEKDVILIREWVDDALAAMKATFRTGPLLAELRLLVPTGKTEPVASLLTPTPAERHGTWTWRQRAAGLNTWPSTAIGKVDSTAAFPDTPPILRDGVLQLSGGLKP
jgi:hypothetical protein